MFRWLLGSVLSLAILLGGMAPLTANAAPGGGKTTHSKVENGKGKKGKGKKGKGKKGRKGGKKGKGKRKKHG